MTKEEAIVKILKILNSRLLVSCKSSRDEALTLAEAHGITVRELITAWTEMAMRV